MTWHTRKGIRKSRRNKSRRIHLYGGDNASFTISNYFNKLDIPLSVKTDLMARLKLDLNALDQNVKKALGITDCKKDPSSNLSSKKWEMCEGSCETLIMDAIEKELNSTAFMMKVIADSVIRPDGKPHTLQFSLDPAFFENNGEKKTKPLCRVLTGNWKEDSPFLHLVLPKMTQNAHGRLVMGFGPSAAGKTHWAKTILSLLKEADPLFPSVFFSIDGGIVRESSVTYQFAKEMAICAGYKGFTNLQDKIFHTASVKNAMQEYYLQESKLVPISLYVPETLGKCEWMKYGISVPFPSCDSYLRPFKDITGDHDNWIGLLIWQHKYAEDHKTDKEFKNTYKGEIYECKGVTASGINRETTEGKKYDNKTYEQSMKNGRKYMMLAPGGRYEIHNAGVKNKTSVMWDMSLPGDVADRFSEIMHKNASRIGVRYEDYRAEAWSSPMKKRNATDALASINDHERYTELERRTKEFSNPIAFRNTPLTNRNANYIKRRAYWLDSMKKK